MGFKTKKEEQLDGKICMKMNVSEIGPNPCKSASRWQKYLKLTWMLNILVVWGSNKQRKRTNGGKICIKTKIFRIPPNTCKSTGRYQRVENELGC